MSKFVRTKVAKATLEDHDEVAAQVGIQYEVVELRANELTSENQLIPQLEAKFSGKYANKAMLLVQYWRKPNIIAYKVVAISEDEDTGDQSPHLYSSEKLEMLSDVMGMIQWWEDLLPTLELADTVEREKRKRDWQNQLSMVTPLDQMMSPDELLHIVKMEVPLTKRKADTWAKIPPRVIGEVLRGPIDELLYGWGVIEGQVSDLELDDHYLVHLIERAITMRDIMNESE
jgi:hypothetical protein